MTTALDDFWRETGPKAPWGPFDPDGRLKFAFGVGLWVASAGTGLTLSTCEVLADPLLSVEAAVVGSDVAVRIRAVDPTALTLGAMLAVTLRMTLSDGQRDDRTFYLLVKDR